MTLNREGVAASESLRWAGGGGTCENKASAETGGADGMENHRSRSAGRGYVGSYLCKEINLLSPSGAASTDTRLDAGQ